MERRLIRQGNGALTVTLPAGWCRGKGLSAGSVVSMHERGGLVEIGSGTSETRRVSVDLRGKPQNTLWHVIPACYIEGADRIEVSHDAPGVVQEISQSLVGMILEEHGSERSIIASIVSVPEENFDVVFRRAAFLLVQQARTLEEISRGKAKEARMDAEDQLLNSHIMYCLRYLNKYGSRDGAYREFLLCATIEKAGDLLKYLGRNIGRRHGLAVKILGITEQYVHGLLRKDFDLLYRVLREVRQDIKKGSFAEGLAFAYAEALYDYLGFLSRTPQNAAR